MRLPIILFIALSVEALGQNAPAKQGIEFFSGSWAQALEEAGRTGKPIFVDFYATWCGPCKQMARNVFTDPVAGEVLSNMICLSIDAEKQEQALVNEVGLRVYPTLFVFDSKGKVAARYEGALDTDGLVQFVHSAFNQEATVAAFQTNPTDPTIAYAYITLEAGKNPGKADSLSTAILNTFSDGQLRTREAWDMLVNYSTRYDSKAFAFVTRNAGWYLKNIVNETEFEKGYGWFIGTMLQRAAETNDEELLKKATQDFITMRKSCGTLNKPEAYFREAIRISYKAHAQDSLYLSDMTVFANRYHPTDWKQLTATSLYVLTNDVHNKKAQQAACTMAYKAMSLNKNPYTLWVAGLAKNSEGKTREGKSLIHLAMQGTKDVSLTLNSSGAVSIDLSELMDTVLSVPHKVK